MGSSPPRPSRRVCCPARGLPVRPGARAPPRGALVGQPPGSGPGTRLCRLEGEEPVFEPAGFLSQYYKHETRDYGWHQAGHCRFYFPSHKLFSSLELVCYHFCHSACSKTVGTLGQDVFTQAQCRSSGKPGPAGVGMGLPPDGIGGPQGKRRFQGSPSSPVVLRSHQPGTALELIETEITGPASLYQTQ